MDNKELLKHVDHTLLSQTATWKEIQAICDDGMKYETASVCIPPSYVEEAKKYVGDKLKICTVIGFPNGYMTSETKAFEAADAIMKGADEIDMVINLGWVKDQKWQEVLRELETMRNVCKDVVLKVIIETCYLTDIEKENLCKLVTESGADYIKTSTGFGTGGATIADVKLFANNIGPELKIKAAGGITGLEDAEKFLAAGADRLGTSRIVKAVKAAEKDK
ncbi:MAG: deoxyribose-phosphate aldolase [Clostridiales bacterium]|nr:deoxyribose-phosphate aldolase [Candidatus Crickella equi]